MKSSQVSTYKYILPFTFGSYFQLLESKVVTGGFLATLKSARESKIQIFEETRIGKN